jgi:hypothetical protein
VLPAKARIHLTFAERNSVNIHNLVRDDACARGDGGDGDDGDDGGDGSGDVSDNGDDGGDDEGDN